MEGNEKIEGAEKGQETPEAGGDSKGGDKPEETDLVSRARAEREMLEKENERLERNLTELRKLRSEEILSGSSRAGSGEEVKKEESSTDYMKKVMSGALNAEGKEEG